MKIEEIPEKNRTKVLNDDEILELVKECFKNKGHIRMGDTLVSYPGEKSLPDAVQVFTIHRVRTFVDIDSKHWK